MIALTRRRVDFRLYTVMKDQQGWTLPQPVPLPASTRSDTDPALAPDGQHIAFVSDRAGHPEVWVAPRDGSAVRKANVF
jgi:Tol biopolymer transport system component